MPRLPQRNLLLAYPFGKQIPANQSEASWLFRFG